MNTLCSIGGSQTTTRQSSTPSLPSASASEARPDRSNGSDTVAELQPACKFLHLRPIRAAGSRPPLICFFPGPPGARDLAAALPEDQPVYEIWWPNVDNESRYPSVEELADLFVSEIRKLQPHGPFQFCGYSTFGLVAYEMGQRLLAQGEDVGFLALFDIWHPQFLQSLTPREMARYRILRVIDRLGKYRRILMKGGASEVASNLARFAFNKAKSIGWRLSQKRLSGAGRPVPKPLQIIASIEANKAYVPPPYPRRFILIRTEDLLDRKLKDHAVGWNSCAPHGIDLHFVEGDHGTIKDKPCVHGLVQKIVPYLAATQIQCSEGAP
ncbi:thioesterase domain-containing protein [Bradyrhizobium sp. F1.4.3]|uniref:thioesterase domain-containing protein n=1 Tax=Bradyrhizobium sp. F1.4.3 TaxID=3156356 RepID=UPI00339443D7